MPLAVVNFEEIG